MIEFVRKQLKHTIFPFYLTRNLYQSNKLKRILYQIKPINHTMGGYIAKLLNSFSDMKAKILMLGLDNAGKTTVLYQMKLHQNVHSVPTIGFNVEQVHYKGLHFTVWDIGGQTKLRGLWQHYYDNVDAVIYVLDTSDAERFEIAKQTLHAVMSAQELKNSPVLVLANKMDVSNLQTVKIVQALGLHQTRRQWHVQPTCALTGDGIVEGFEWLKNTLKKRK